VKRLIRGLVHRGRALLGRNRAAVELDEEIRYHIQLAGSATSRTLRKKFVTRAVCAGSKTC
jgi:hypothetical protein